MILRAASLPGDAALLTDLNEGYVQLVFGGVAARFGVSLAGIFPRGEIRADAARYRPDTHRSDRLVRTAGLLADPGLS
jgi:carbonic anhydrase